MTNMSGDEAMFTMRKGGSLIGICILHVDDFLVSGTDKFLEDLAKKLKGRFTFGRIDSEQFKFTGLNIKQDEDFTIHVDQEDFIDS